MPPPQPRHPHDKKLSTSFVQLEYALHEAADDNYLGEDRALLRLAAGVVNGTRAALVHRDRHTLEQLVRPFMETAKQVSSPATPRHLSLTPPLRALRERVQQVLDRPSNKNPAEADYRDVAQAILDAAEDVLSPIGLALPAASSEDRSVAVATALWKSVNNSRSAPDELISAGLKAMGLPAAKVKNLWSAEDPRAPKRRKTTGPSSA